MLNAQFAKINTRGVTQGVLSYTEEGSTLAVWSVSMSSSPSVSSSASLSSSQEKSFLSSLELAATNTSRCARAMPPAELPGVVSQRDIVGVHRNPLAVAWRKMSRTATLPSDLSSLRHVS